MLLQAHARELDLTIFHLGHVLFDCREFIEIESGFWRHGLNKAMGGSRMDGKNARYSTATENLAKGFNTTFVPSQIL
jgi:hypothetical protein